MGVWGAGSFWAVGVGLGLVGRKGWRVWVSRGCRGPSATLRMTEFRGEGVGLCGVGLVVKKGRRVWGGWKVSGSFGYAQDDRV